MFNSPIFQTAKNKKCHTSSDNIGLSLLITLNFMREMLQDIVEKRFLLAQ